MIDRAFARQAFINALGQTVPDAFANLASRSGAAWRSGAYQKDLGHHTVVADAWLSCWFPPHPSAPRWAIPPWLRRWAEHLAHDVMFHCLVERLEHEQGVRLERPTLGLLVDELEWAVEDRHDADNSVALPTPRPAETTTEFVARVRRLRRDHRAQLRSRGLLSVSRKPLKLARDAEWYVLACLVGTRPTQIQNDAAARDEHLDLATIKKAIDAFAALVDLPTYPKQPFAPRPRQPQRRAKTGVN